jgi:hypothetical protein
MIKYFQDNIVVEVLKVVTKGECYITKFGSIHASKEEAEKVELREEREDFAKFFANIIIPDSEYEFDDNNFCCTYDLGLNIYNNLENVIKAINNYDFIKYRFNAELDFFTGNKLDYNKIQEKMYFLLDEKTNLDSNCKDKIKDINSKLAILDKLLADSVNQ